MNHVKRTLSALLLVALLCTLMTTVVLAEENQAVWLGVTENTEAGTVTALLVTNTTVTDGYIKLTYDAGALTYQGLTVNGDYVSQHSVNPQEPGTVKIAWIAPGEYAASGKGLSLIQITFAGTDASSLILSGIIHDAAGNEISLAQVDTAALSAAITAAEALDPAAYTGESWAAVSTALAEAKTVLVDLTATQAEADAAAAKLQAAMAALEEAPAVPPTEDPTEKPTQPGNNNNTGDETPLVLLIVLMMACLVGIVVLIVIMSRKGRKE